MTKRPPKPYWFEYYLLMLTIALCLGLYGWMAVDAL